MDGGKKRFPRAEFRGIFLNFVECGMGVKSGISIFFVESAFYHHPYISWCECILIVKKFQNLKHTAITEGHARAHELGFRLFCAPDYPQHMTRENPTRCACAIIPKTLKNNI